MLDEDALIAAVRQRARELVPAHTAEALRGAVGIGDDCCIWTPQGAHDPLCLSVDAIAEDRHFTRAAARETPQAIGRKAAAAALSDLAAMGALPLFALVALSCPEDCDGVAVMDGLIAELARHGCALLGGDTTGATALVISVTVVGQAPAGGRLLTRSGGGIGDLLVVTGALGGSLASGRHLRPEPRLAEGRFLAAQPAVHALMDLSDGLAADARKLAAASSCGCLLFPDDVPVHPDVPPVSDTARAALCDGEDYELLAALDAAAWPTLRSTWPFDLPLTIVGQLTREPGAWCEDRHGRRAPLLWQGFAHGSRGS